MANLLTRLGAWLRGTDRHEQCPAGPDASAWAHEDEPPGDDFGALREVLHGAPSPAQWTMLCKLLERAWLRDETQCREWSLYAGNLLERWPDTLRECPERWLRAWRVGHRCPPLHVVRKVSLPGRLSYADPPLNHTRQLQELLDHPDLDQLTSVLWLYCGMSQSGALLRTLSTHPRVRNLRETRLGWPYSRDTIRALDMLPSTLETLYITPPNAPLRWLEEHQRRIQRAHLKTLHITGALTLFGERELPERPLRDLPTIRFDTINGTGDQLTALVAHLPNIQADRWYLNGITASGVSAIDTASEGLLQNLHLNEDVSREPEWSLALAHSDLRTRVHTLSINLIDDAELSLLTAIPQASFPQTHTLMLNVSEEVRPAMLQRLLTPARFPTLCGLHLHTDTMTDEGLAALAAGGLLDQLTTLELGSHMTTDQGLAHMLQRISTPKLATLILHMPFSTQSARALCALDPPALRALETLGYEYEYGINEETAQVMFRSDLLERLDEWMCWFDDDEGTWSDLTIQLREGLYERCPDLYIDGWE